MPPQLITRPRNQTVSPGQTVTFQCETTGNPPPAVFWQKEGSQVRPLPTSTPTAPHHTPKPSASPSAQTLLFPGQSPPPASRISVASSGAMTIATVQPTDAGYYLCQAISVAGSILAKALLEVEAGRWWRWVAVLRVLKQKGSLNFICTAAPAEPRPPLIRWGPANLTVLPVGATVQLPCWAEGEPPPRVGWLKDGRTVPGSEGRASLLENGTLQISSLRVSCTGTGEQGDTVELGRHWDG